MRDVVKTNVKREQNQKRKRRRRRHTMLYFILVIFMVTGIGVLLSVTLFFNVKKITVNGEVNYTKESVIMTSGISDGDNLIRLDSEKVSRSILSSMIYVETAYIDKQFPGTVVINLTKCVPTANIDYGNGFLVVSAKGKILEDQKSPSEGLPIVKGVSVTEKKPGRYFKSDDAEKDEAVMEFIRACSMTENNKVTSIDVSDLYDLSVNYQDRITFKMGKAKDMSYKLNLAGTVLEKIGNNKKGVMSMVGTNQISFREKRGGASSEPEPQTPAEGIPRPTQKPTEPPAETSEENVWTDEPGYDDYNDGGYDDGGGENYDDGGYDDGGGDNYDDGGYDGGEDYYNYGE